MIDYPAFSILCGMKIAHTIRILLFKLLDKKASYTIIFENSSRTGGKEVGFAMEENDFKRIEQLVSSVVDARMGRFEEEVAEKIDSKLGQLRKEVNEDFRHHVGILTEDFQHKLQLVAEGHQMLSEKLDRVEVTLENKMDSISTELAAHRADTEGHRRGYMVKEP